MHELKSNTIVNNARLIIFLIAVLSSVIRLIINYSTDLMPGAVGAFYLVQVRSVIETGFLTYNEFPLIFYIETALAKAIIVLCGMSTPDAIDNAVRIFDAVIPVFSIVPAFLLVDKVIDVRNQKYLGLMCASFSVLYFSFFTLVSDYQKNTFALVWLFSLLLAVYNYLEKGGAKNLYIIIFFYLALGVTHFGSFAISNLFMLLTVGIKYLHGTGIKKIFLLAAEITALIAVGAGLIYYFSPDRLELLINSYKEIFYEPILFLIFDGNITVSPVDIVNLIFVNAVGLIAAYILIIKKDEISRHKKIFIAACIVMDLTLAFPLLGVEWGQRLYLMAYIFVVPLIAFVIGAIESRKINSIFISVLILIFAASVSTSLIIKQYSNIERDGYREIENMKYVFEKEGSHLIVARLGLNYWLDWILRKSIAQEKDVKPNWWKSFDNIYYIKQVKGAVPFGTAGLFGKPFKDPVIPDDSELIFKGNYYHLYLAHNPSENLMKNKKDN